MRAALLSLLVAGVATAAEPAHYHPDDVAKASARFAEVAGAMGPAFEERSGRLASLGASLGELEIGVALLGSAAPPEVTAWSDTARRQLVGEKVRLQKHVDLLQEDYGAVFGAAVERALPTVGKGLSVKECGATGVAAMMGRKSCVGTDLNGPLAKAIDADATLAKELADIGAVEWPSFEVPTKRVPVVTLTGTERWVSGGALAQKLVGARLKAKRLALETALAGILPDDPTEADIAAAKAEKDAYLADLGRDGETLRAALAEALGRAEKKGGPAKVGWCANPAALGGCAGEDVTAAVLAALAADKAFARKISGLTE
jgi:hypothetical protein